MSSTIAPPTILVTGVHGQIGSELVAAVAPHGTVIALDRGGLDLTDVGAIARVVRDTAPTIIVNAAAYTAVDRAESDAANAFAINATAVGVMAEEARRANAVLIHFSTDNVFDGRRDTPYDEAASTGPLNVYGQSKLAGERAIAASGATAVILRTGWVYGLRGTNFLLTIRRLAAERDELRIVADQTGTPNWARSIAETTATLVGRGATYLAERKGLYHVSAGGSATWFEFARVIVGDAKSPRVIPIRSSEYPSPARRPAYGVLSTELFARTFDLTLPDWRTLHARCISSPAEPPPAQAVG